MRREGGRNSSIPVVLYLPMPVHLHAHFSAVVNLADCPAPLRSVLQRFDTDGTGLVNVNTIEHVLLRGQHEERTKRMFQNPGRLLLLIAVSLTLLAASLLCSDGTRMKSSTITTFPAFPTSSARFGNLWDREGIRSEQISTAEHTRLLSVNPSPPPSVCCACAPPPPISPSPIAPSVAEILPVNSSGGNATVNGTAGNATMSGESETEAGLSKPPSPDIQIEDLPEILAYLGVIMGVGGLVWVMVTCFIHPTQLWKDFCFCKCLK